ncbi:zinc finger protein 593 homolog isoform X2 [Papaver somniferum]|uniref:zinc finger protein 593 homolog isoform X2 n=1 Tax=Papaver somniferum TaxID=3469 RepID=UPI000E6F73F9|nr:zinc finger protein 593 homolog isoform X2 [Papaver somniferum]XP_026415134.1 zinc finger protein 593 homolog isoform X2 [Papaver somniferum]
MGKCPHRKVKKRRLSHKTARRTKFETKGDDTVYSELRKPEAEKPVLPLDDDLPGMGQFYCLHCDVKFMKGPAPHTQLDADIAAGMGMPDNGPKLMVA